MVLSAEDSRQLLRSLDKIRDKYVKVRNETMHVLEQREEEVTKLVDVVDTTSTASDFV